MKKLSLFKGLAGSFLFLIVLSLIFAGVARAQSGRATVKGLVQDQQSNVVAGATVTLSDQNKNFSRTQTSNQDGGYIFAAIPPGTYRIEVEAAGFKKTVINDVQAAVDTTMDVNAALEVGQVTETVNVASTNDAPLNTNDATIGTSFDRQRISDLPLNAGNVVALLSLQPGVTRTGYVNGGRADQANVTLDGIDVNEQQRGLDVVTDEAFASVIRVTRERYRNFVSRRRIRMRSGPIFRAQCPSSRAQVRMASWLAVRNAPQHSDVANDFSTTGRRARPQLCAIFWWLDCGPINGIVHSSFHYEGFREATATRLFAKCLCRLWARVCSLFTDSGASIMVARQVPRQRGCLTPTEINNA